MNSRIPQRSVRRAFTLIELLVVIAIISILSAILFPVFAQAREAARKTSCASNEKQMGSAFLMYVQDYDETWPGIWNGEWNVQKGKQLNWASAIQPYIKNRKLYHCPSDFVKGVSVSYDANLWLHNRGDAGLPAPTDLVVLMDGYTSEGSINAEYDGTDPYYNDPNTGKFADYGLNACYTFWDHANRVTRSDKGLPRHTSMNNVLFADGHVKTTAPLKRWGDPQALSALEAALPFSQKVYQDGGVWSNANN